MTRITKVVARHIARELTQAKRDAIAKDEETLKEIMTGRYLATVPKLVLDGFKKYPKYFKTDNGLTVIGAGFNHDYISIHASPDKVSGRIALSLFSGPGNEAIFDQYTKVKDDITKLQDLRRDIENSLISLGTYAKIREQFPEAAPYLVDPVSTAVSINLDKIRKQL